MTTAAVTNRERHTTFRLANPVVERDAPRTRIRSMTHNISSLCTDELGLIFRFLSLPYLIAIKCVNTEWAKAVRHTIHNPEWTELRRVITNHRSVPPRFCRYETAAEAFATLDAAPKVDKRLVTKKCKQLAKIHGVHLLSGGADRVVYHLFKNNTKTGSMFNKSMKIIQKKDSDKIYILSDLYHIDTDKLNRFALKCASGGMDVFVFELDYHMKYDDQYHPPANVKMLADGYPYLYRGKLAGFIV